MNIQSVSNINQKKQTNRAIMLNQYANEHVKCRTKLHVSPKKVLIRVENLVILIVW